MGNKKKKSDGIIVFMIIIVFILLLIFGRKKDVEYQGIDKVDIDLINLPRKTRSFKPFESKAEKRCKEIIENIFNQPFHKVRPSFLKYQNGSNLELDMYNSDLNLAIEVNGIQHRKYTPYFHKSIEDFNAQQQRDQFKKEMCEKAGVNLIIVPDTVKYDDLETFIKDKVREVKELK